MEGNLEGGDGFTGRIVNGNVVGDRVEPHVGVKDVESNDDEEGTGLKVGHRVGSNDGVLTVGEDDGVGMGLRDGIIEEIRGADGETDRNGVAVGEAVRKFDGKNDGKEGKVVGANEGSYDRLKDGETDGNGVAVGEAVGKFDGKNDGNAEGKVVGSYDRLNDGETDGNGVGAEVGTLVGTVGLKVRVTDGDEVGLSP
eukprot:CAMPEP_0201113454 /NCGR_PEP_ID=MMETSP0812-20130820/77855_1 /ASSEMBLY_ACC=CAM_ASM_000668 /TAXON_ID=98059 /ORGANISM="Dinobryon sp., Strain UTEXLB2267" /LENGTH=196 /DNA_ID=CAMNT_0047376989 /DNA_START=1670 /DNA_END=2260 /DNA_ORIENTATION=+